MKIINIKSREVLDSRGNPTIGAIVYLENGFSGQALVPSGASTGSYEAVELRDKDEKRYGGAGVLQAMQNIEEIISPALIGFDASDQTGLDRKLIELDGSENKSKLGANAILAVSLAATRASAAASKEPLYRYLTRLNPDFSGSYILPLPMMNVLNGGKHADWATDIQEYMIIPVGASSLAQAVRMSVEVYQALKSVLKKKGYGLGVGDEGGFAPTINSNGEAFELLATATTVAGYRLGQDIVFGIDAAATEFLSDGKYHLKKENKILDGAALVDFYSNLSAKYPIVSWEDIFAEDDWSAFQGFTAKFGASSQVVGDDLYVTNIKRLEQGIASKATNSILIKLNQIGTLSETVSAILLARRHGLTSVISHRSGETEDTFIADLAVAMGTGQIKTGAPARSERTAKYNRLMEIEQELGSSATLASFPFEF